MVHLLEVRYWKQADVTYILRQFNDRFEDSSLTDSVMRYVSWSSKMHLPVCLFVCLSVCESVCLSICHIRTFILFQTETTPCQNNANWSTQRKYEVVIMDHPGNSGGEHVCPVFQGL